MKGTFRVVIRFAENSIFYKKGGKFETLYNITEIHYRYPSIIGEPVRVAFESDIEGTGYTYRVDEIAEFEAKLLNETK